MLVCRRVVIAIVLLFTVGYSLSAMALPPEMEADRLLLSAAKHLGSPEATAEFEKIRELNIKLPTEYYYYYGKHLYETLNLKEADENIRKYLEKTGREGLYYRDSLQLITDIEEEAKRLARFIDHANGTITDTKTGLMWAAQDNGYPIKWRDALLYCQRFRGGGFSDWRLPTQEELASLYDPKDKNRYGYHITRLIDLTDCCPWASEIRGSEAAVVAFSSGNRYWGYQSFSSRSRVLPVRSIKR
ncbi:MAG: DUF1566 domain-containing protein [Desulfatiglandales bacterium]